MRILILSNVPPLAIGGAEVQALQLAECWSVLGHQVTIAGVAAEPLRRDGLEIVRIPILNCHRVLRGASYMIATLWLLWTTRKRFDLVYCRFLKEHAFVACLARVAGLIDVPIIACPACAGREKGDVAEILRSPFRGILIAVYRRGLAAINAMSNRIAQELEVLDLDGILVCSIPNGAQTFPELVRHPRPDGPLRIIAVGRLVRQKGLDILLSAVRKTTDLGCDVSVRIVGDGPLLGDLSSLSYELRLTDRVTFVGEVLPDKIYEEFANADLFVLCSRYEGMPGVLLQAMGSGLPVVATCVSGAEDIIHDRFGWLVPIDDSDALANAIQESCNKGRNELVEMGNVARTIVIHEYGIEFVARRYEELFFSLVVSHNSRGESPIDGSRA